MDAKIQAAIQMHGARAVYAAANLRFSGDSSKLAAMGLDAPTLADANEIQSEAFRQMGAADRAIDLACTTSKRPAYCKS